MLVKKFLKNYKEYDKISNISNIARRVFANNSFDGILTIMGILLGAYYAGIDSAMVIIKTGLGASIAMGVSGAWGAYYTEKAERKKKIHELENNKNFRIFPSIRFLYFLTILKHAKFILGNSSAAVREAEVFGTPAINIGSRQKNRSKNKEIINVEPKKI